jgi:hypothetical protein
MRHVLTVLLLLAATATSAAAQELATTVDQLRVLVKAGDTLIVSDRSGRQVRGRLVRFAGTTIEIAEDQAVRVYRPEEIANIQLRYADSLANGAKIGFGIGAGLGVLAGLAIAGELNAAAAVPTIILMYGAMGAGIGVGVDGLTSSTRIIFSRPVTSTGVRVEPDLRARTAAVRMAISW